MFDLFILFGYVWYLIVSIPDLCTLTYLDLLFLLYPNNVSHPRFVVPRMSNILVTQLYVSSTILLYP